MILPSRCDVVVIGAGIAGCAVARELLARGVEPIVLDRAEAPPTESTARSAWMIRTDAPEPAVEAIARRGGELWRSGRLGTFRPTGGFLIGRGEADDAAAHVPAARGRGQWRPQDGIVDAASALAALRPPEARLIAGTPVLGLEDAPDGIDVRTPRGNLRARIVVNAAGAWAGEIGGLPMSPLKRHVVLAECGAVASEAPFTWDVNEQFYFLPHEAGLLLCACDERPSAPGDNAVEEGAADAVLALARRLQPGLGTLVEAGIWAGQRTFAPDRRFVLGWDPRRRGLFHVAALGGHGITVAPALAEPCAEAIAAGPDTVVPPVLLPFSPERLALEPLD